jgi:uncharacterized protein (TIGR02284 family)
MHQAEIELLNRLLAICEDARNFYRTAAGSVSDPRLEDTFQAFAQIRAEIMFDLTRLICDHGGTPAQDGTFEGRAAQFFGELAAQQSDSPEQALLKYLQETEERSLAEFEGALHQALPPGTRRMLAGHADILRATRGRMEGITNRYAA